MNEDGYLKNSCYCNTPKILMDSTPINDHVELGSDTNMDTEIRELKGRYKRQKDLNTDLQEALEKADVEVNDLSSEISSLKNENSQLQKEIWGIRSILEEMDHIKYSLMTYEEESYKALQAKLELEKRYVELEKRVEQFCGQVEECQRDNKILHDGNQKLKMLITALERSLENKNIDMKKREEFFTKRESAIEELAKAVEEYISTTEDIKSRIQVLEHCLENTSQETVLNKTTEQLSGTEFGAAVNGTLMCEIIEAEMEERLLRKYHERERLKSYGFLGLRLLWSMVIHLFWGCITVLCSSGFLLIAFTFMAHLLHTWNPLSTDERRCGLGNSMLFPEILQPFLMLSNTFDPCREIND